MTAIEHTLDRVYTLDWMSSAAKNECTAAVGFKWMLNQACKSSMNFALFCFYWVSLKRDSVCICISEKGQLDSHNVDPIDNLNLSKSLPN